MLYQDYKALHMAANAYAGYPRSEYSLMKLRVASEFIHWLSLVFCHIHNLDNT